jgi:hypothetical protein
MNKFYFILLFPLLLTFNSNAQTGEKLVSRQQQKTLLQLSDSYQLKATESRKKAFALAKIYHWDTYKINKDGSLKSLQGLDALGRPLYLHTLNNTTAAATTRTNSLYQNGTLGLNINGSSTYMANKLAIWDGGSPLTTHQEYIGRIIIKDGTSTVSFHSTHVAGTLIAKGINPVARGMAWGAPNLWSYDFDNDVPEAAASAPSLLVSNHSYAYQAGWDQGDKGWEWFGVPGQTEDYKFGIYEEITRSWDVICNNAPYYLPVFAAGNSRSINGPAVGDSYYGYPANSDTAVFMGSRPAGISNNDGFDIISVPCTAKNILTVGAIYGLGNGATKPSDIQISAFSSWGPTDDGRIKPDLVADGVDLLSCSNTNNSAYNYSSGTSMATPNVSGSIFLLQEYYAQVNGGKFMKSSTLKGLALHTTDEAGNSPGPDYVYGWGLLNMERAASTIKNNGMGTLITEKTLQQDSIFSRSFVSSGTEPVKVTICWTDPSGTATPDGTLNSRTPKLVNDLDIRLDNGSIIYLPWVLDPNNPAKAATNGDNILDNIEQITTQEITAGQLFNLSISHKGTLLNGSQNYSLFISGISGDLMSPISRDFNVSVYPIPTKNNLTVSFTSLKKENFTYYISNTSGQKFDEETINNVSGIFSKTIALDKLNDGVYFIKLKLGDKFVTKKIVKNHNAF